MYAVTFALPDESRDFRKLLTLKKERRLGRGTVQIGTLHGVDVAVAHLGVGKAAAAEGIAALLDDFQPELLLCAGYGGALDPELRVGDLLLDLRFAGTQVQSPISARLGTIHTSSDAVGSVAAKRDLHSETRAQVVDMETAIVGAACSAAGVPMLALRVISDEAGQPLPVPMVHWFDPSRQRPRPLALVCYLLQHPSAIMPFAHFVRGLSRARARLASELSGIIADAAKRSGPSTG